MGALGRRRLDAAQYDLFENPKTGKHDLSNQDYPKKNSKYQSKNAGVNKLGSHWFGDAIYKLAYTFDHDADKLVLKFRGDLFEGKGTDDEAWGLDNVKVTAHANAKVKEPTKPTP